MRLTFLAAVAATTVAIPVTAAAQDDFEDEFDDEFGDEFGDQQQGQQRPAGDDLAEAEAEVEGDIDAEEPAAAPADDEALRAQAFRAHNTWSGPVGGFHVVDAGSGAVDSFRVQLATEFFSTSSFLEPGDDHDHIGGSLSLSWTIADFVEVYASLASYANSNPAENPALFQVLGDTLLGAKFFYNLPSVPWLTVGGDVGIGFLNTVGDIGLVLKSTSFGLRGNLSGDFRRLAKPIPLVARFGLQYWFDNSEGLVEDVEQERFANLEDPAPRIEDETRHLLSRVERFALQINRTDFFNIGLGLEAPLQAATDFYIHPLLEWTWSIPVNRQGYDCLFIPREEGSDEPAEGDDGCLDIQGVGAFPMTLTLGVRVLPPVKGLSFMAGVDIGLTGVSEFVRELAPNAPYNVLFGASYAYDTRPPPSPEPVVREVERRVEVQLPPPLLGRVRGTVLEQGAGTPVAGAVIRFPGRELTPLYVAEDGTFTTYALPPGEVQLEVTHAEYQPGTCAATIPDQRPEGDAELIVETRCELIPLPRVGTVEGRVLGEEGAALNGAQVQLSGPQTRTLTTDVSGNFRAAELPPGTYNARVEIEGYLIKTQQFEVRARETTNVQVDMIPRPRQALVRVRARDIQIRRQINFATDSAEILASSDPLMYEIADVMIRNPQIRLVEIQGHTDNTGSDAHNMDLSQRRAESVRQWLINHGVESSRMEARGYGATQPLVPNITPANRARNRRVQFIIKEQGDAAPATR